MLERDRQAGAARPPTRSACPPRASSRLSAEQGLVAKMQDDRDAPDQEPPLPPRAGARAHGMVAGARGDHARAVRAEVRSALAEIALADQEPPRLRAGPARRAHGAAGPQPEAGGDPRAEGPLGARPPRAGARHRSSRSARCEHRHLDALSQAARSRTPCARPRIRTRAAVIAQRILEAASARRSTSSSANARDRLREAIEHDPRSARPDGRPSSRKFDADYQIAAVEVARLRHRPLLRGARPPRAALRARFQAATAACSRGAARRSARSSSTTVALKVVHIFEIADREVRAWMNGFIRPLEAQLTPSRSRPTAASRAWAASRTPRPTWSRASRSCGARRRSRRAAARSGRRTTRRVHGARSRRTD